MTIPNALIIPLIMSRGIATGDEMNPLSAVIGLLIGFLMFYAFTKFIGWRSDRFWRQKMAEAKERDEIEAKERDAREGARASQSSQYRTPPPHDCANSDCVEVRNIRGKVGCIPRQETK